MQHLAAGEVIDGPAAVIRELVENSIDANATNIVVSIKPRSRSILVRDDGHGISSDSGFSLIAKCNATSKLRTVEDLGDLRTLGFRGQALWAVASFASNLSVASRTIDADGFSDETSDFGICARFDRDGSIQNESIRPMAMNIGTVVHAEGMHGLDFGQRSLRECKEWLCRTSLYHADVLFTLQREDVTLWTSMRRSETSVIGVVDRDAEHLRSAFAAFLRKDSVNFHYYLHENKNDIDGHVELVFGLPGVVHYPTAANIVLAVNGRCVDVPQLNALVRGYFRSCLPSRRYPAVFIHVKASKRGVCDWNLHPMKTTMRLGTRDVPCDASRVIHEALNAAVSSAPFARLSAPSFTMGNEYCSLVTDSNAYALQALKLAANSALQDGAVRSERGSVQFANEQVAQHEFQELPGSPVSFVLWPVAQVLGTYIIAENATGIVLIEQHVAHERILFEQLKSSWSSSFVSLGPDQEIELPAYIGDDDEKLLNLSCLGFQVDRLEERRVAVVRSVPNILRHLSVQDVLRTILKLSDSVRCTDDAAATLACRGAVKNGTPLSMSRMRDIVNGLQKCMNPHTCPHGRPICWDINEQELAKVFQRRWSPRRSRKRRVSGNLED